MKLDTVGELKKALEDIDDDVVVRVALQPNYPLGGHLVNTCIQANMVWLAVSDGEDYTALSEMWEMPEVPFEEEEE